MTVERGESEAMLVEMLERLVDDRLRREGAEWERMRGVPASARKVASDLGLWSLLSPEEAGGAGFGWRGLVDAVSVLARGSASLALAVGQHAVVCAAFRDADSPTQRLLAEGRTLAGILPAGAARADGRHCCFGVRPELVAVADGSRVALRELAAITGVRSASGLRSAFHASGVDVGRVVAEVDLGTWGDAVWEGWSRLCVAAILHGLAVESLQRALRYAHERVAFGQPIVQFQAVQWKLADMATRNDAAWLLIDDVAQSIGERGPSPVGAAHAFVAACAAARLATDEAVQIHGGYGFTAEYRVEQFQRDAITLAGWEGGAEAAARLAASGNDSVAVRLGDC